MNFKDIIQKDLGTFVNTEEFAEVHNVDGRDIPALIDSDALLERPRQPLDLYNAANGVFLANITMYVRGTDLEDRPVVGQRLRLDGKIYPVSSCDESAGMLKIVLEVNQA